MKIRYVDGEEIRKKHVEFTMGGHHQRYDWIPEGEIWIDKHMGPTDQRATLLHELIEEYRMREKGQSYDEAHSHANRKEEKFRNLSEGKMDKMFRKLVVRKLRDDQ